MSSPTLLFVTDIFAHSVAWVGGALTAAGVLEVFIGEKLRIPRKWAIRLGVFFLFIACCQAWFDEHHNVATLIEQKASLSSRNGELTSQLAYKERPVEIHIDPSTLKSEPVKHSKGAMPSASHHPSVQSKRSSPPQSSQGASPKQSQPSPEQPPMQQTPVKPVVQSSAQPNEYFGSAPHVNLPPPDGSLNVSQAEETSTRADAPNHIKVVVQTTKTFSSLKLVVECNRDIVDGRAEPSGGGAIMMSQQGTAQGHPNIFIAAYGSATPPFSPSNPWVFDLWSKGPMVCPEAATF